MIVYQQKEVIEQITHSNLSPAIRGKMITSIIKSEPLDVALGIRSKNGRTRKTREITQRRDTFLQKIAMEYPGSEWVKACNLADEIAKFPATKHRKTFEYMYSEGMKLPTTPERIYQILKTS